MQWHSAAVLKELQKPGEVTEVAGGQEDAKAQDDSIDNTPKINLFFLLFIYLSHKTLASNNIITFRINLQVSFAIYNFRDLEMLNLISKNMRINLHPHVYL